jgi:cytochrome oxidase Cu insertion factor (SCO1/SenC/PrrC family)
VSSIASQASAGRALTRRSSAGRTGLVLGALLVLAAAGSLWLAARAQTATEDLPVLAAVPDFTLTEASGRTVTRQDLAGHPYVVDLVFTHCGGICPTMSAAMSRLVGSTSTLPDLRFVSISVDPKNDTPEVLTAYAERFQADRTRWLFLTGDEKAASASCWSMPSRRCAAPTTFVTPKRCSACAAISSV